MKILLLFLFLSFSSFAFAINQMVDQMVDQVTDQVADQFDGFHCPTDIRKMLGKTVVNDAVVQIEKRHAEIGLKNLGADGLAEDPYQLESWQICGNEYLFLIDQKNKKGTIADVLAVPAALKSFARSLPGSDCRQNGKKRNDLYAILKTDSVGKSVVKKAWKISVNKMKFIQVSVKGLVCAK